MSPRSSRSWREMNSRIVASRTSRIDMLRATASAPRDLRGHTQGKPPHRARRLRHEERTDRLELEAGAFDDRANRPIEVAAARDDVVEAVEAILPARHPGIFGAAVLQDDQPAL